MYLERVPHGVWLDLWFSSLNLRERLYGQLRVKRHLSTAYVSGKLPHRITYA